MRLKALQADTDERLPRIRSRLLDYSNAATDDKASAKRVASDLLNYVSSALSDSHASALRKAAIPIFDKGGGWKPAISKVQKLTDGLADSMTVDDIQPFAVQALGHDNVDMFRPVELTPTSPQWMVTRDEFPLVPLPITATGSGSSQALRFPGEDTAYAMDYECRPHISERCRVRIVYRPKEGKEYTIYIRMAGRKPGGQAANNQWFAVAFLFHMTHGLPEKMASMESGHSVNQDYDHEWYLELEHKNRSSGWVEVEVDVWPEHEKTLATRGFKLVAVSGVRVRGYVDIAAIEFLPIDLE